MIEQKLMDIVVGRSIEIDPGMSLAAAGLFTLLGLVFLSVQIVATHVKDRQVQFA